jgi:hypothetical protein
MERVRSDLVSEVDQVVEQAREWTDWRGLVRQHPWISFGLAVAGGYLLVPKRAPVLRADAATLQELARNGGLVLQPRTASPVGGSLVSNLATAAAGLAVKSLMGMAERRLNQLMPSNGRDK